MNPFLLIAFFVTGFVDSIGGGGGLISVPALLTAGIPLPLLLGTNKSLAATGSSVAVFQYARAGLLPSLSGRAWFFLVCAAFTGGCLGAAISRTTMVMRNLDFMIPVFLFTVMAFLIHRWFWVKPRPGSFEAHPVSPRNAAPMVGLIGGYDGVFGPGTGAIFLSYFERRGFPTVEANAITKVFNLSSNLGALLFFAANGAVMWRIGLMAAAACMLGNGAGSFLVLKRGQAVVRATVLVVTTVMLFRYFAIKFY